MGHPWQVEERNEIREGIGMKRVMRHIFSSRKLSVIPFGALLLSGLASHSVLANADNEPLESAELLGSGSEVVADVAPQRELSFTYDVLPILGKYGCNSGGCHSKPNGQAGFQMSVFSFDPKKDYKEITQDSSGRRVFPAYPEASLLLLKPTQSIPHEGGKRFEIDSAPYRTLKQWIAQGMLYRGANEPDLESIQVNPATWTAQQDSEFEMTVTAVYSDGSQRDVSALSEFVSSDKEFVRFDEEKEGVAQIGRQSGEGVALARFLGQVAVTQILVPVQQGAEVENFDVEFPANNFIDTLAKSQFDRLRLEPSELCSDEEFLRRAHWVTLGTLPTTEEAKWFIADEDPEKRSKLVDRILDRQEYAEFWAGKWADWIRPNPFRVGGKSVYIMDQWLRKQFRENRRYDEMVQEILTAQGSSHRDGPVTLYRDRREPEELTTLISQIFLGVRLECARCHHHPNEKWSQEDFYDFAAYFAELKNKGTGISPPISGSAEMFYHQPGGSVTHPVTEAVMKPRPLGAQTPAAIPNKQDPRKSLADWMTAPDNPYFAKAVVNRVWGELFGKGFVNPVDDFRVSNPVINEPLLDALSEQFVRDGYDFKELIRVVLNSRLFQLSSNPSETNLADTQNFSRYYRMRAPAEALLDAVNDITGSSDRFYGLSRTARAIQTWNHKLPSDFMDAFGRPDGNADCPCDRVEAPSLTQALHLMHSDDLQRKIAYKKGRVAELVNRYDNSQMIDELYLSVYSRYPDPEEKTIALGLFDGPEIDRKEAAEDLLWALLNSAEFVFNH